jgi:hypothetical protein
MLICLLKDGVLSTPVEHTQVFGAYSAPSDETLANAGYVQCTYNLSGFDPLTQVKEPSAPYMQAGKACLVTARNMTDEEIDIQKQIAMTRLRESRNAALSACDFTQLDDYPGDKAVWAVYRQALRDLPQNTADARLGVNWPVSPSSPINP